MKQLMLVKGHNTNTYSFLSMNEYVLFCEKAEEHNILLPLKITDVVFPLIHESRVSTCELDTYAFIDIDSLDFELVTNIGDEIEISSHDIQISSIPSDIENITRVTEFEETYRHVLVNNERISVFPFKNAEKISVECKKFKNVLDYFSIVLMEKVIYNSQLCVISLQDPSKHFDVDEMNNLIVCTRK